MWRPHFSHMSGIEFSFQALEVNPWASAVVTNHYLTSKLRDAHPESHGNAQGEKADAP